MGEGQKLKFELFQSFRVHRIGLELIECVDVTGIDALHDDGQLLVDVAQRIDERRLRSVVRGGVTDAVLRRAVTPRVVCRLDVLRSGRSKINCKRRLY